MLGSTNIPGKLMENLSISLNGGTPLTYNGISIKSLNITASSIGAAVSNHNHDTVYSKLNHVHSKTNITDFPTSMPANGGNADTVDGKHATDFAPSTHSHNYIPTSASCNKNWYWSGQAGQPTWLWGGNDPSNVYLYNPNNFSVKYATSAGNADTIDGIHAWEMQTLSSTGNAHGPIDWKLVCQHNVNGDGRFFIKTTPGNIDVSVAHSKYSDNSYCIQGRGPYEFVTSPFFNGNNNIGNWVDVDRAVISDISLEEGSPTGSWAHYISMPHRGRNSHTAQILVPFFNNPTLFCRTSPGGNVGDFGRLSMAWMSHTSNACLISAGAPGDGRLLWAW